MGATIVMKKTEGLPPKRAGGGGGGTSWTPQFEAAAQAMGEEGGTMLLATFTSRGGAAKVATRVRKGEIDVPGGADSWTLRPKEVWSDVDSKGEQECLGSELHVYYHPGNVRATSAVGASKRPRAKKS
jgi:hypothetical protein